MVMVVVPVLQLLLHLFFFKLFPHIVCILSIRIVLGFNVVNFVTQSRCVEIERRPIASTNVERHVLSSKDTTHGVLSGGHELRCETELAVSADDGEGGDVTVARLTGGKFLFHLGENVADDFASVVLGDVKELGPRQNVIKVVFHLIVFGETQKIARLHRQKIVHSCLTDAHHFLLNFALFEIVSRVFDFHNMNVIWE